MTEARELLAGDPAPRDLPQPALGSPKWFVRSVIGCAALFGVVVLGLVIREIGVQTGHVPADKVLSETEVPRSTIEWLRGRQLLGSDERVLSFYAYGLVRFSAGGCFVTNRRIVGFGPSRSGGLDVFSAELGDVIVIDYASTSWFGEWAYVDVETADGRKSRIGLSSSKPDDDAFVDLLMQAWRSQRDSASRD